MQTLTTLAIRPFCADDYDIVTQLHNTTFVDFVETTEEFRLNDEQYPAKCRWSRWVAECDGRVVGFAEYHQSPWSYHPHKFGLEVAVDPAHAGQGIGSRLHDIVMESVQSLEPISIDTWAREDMPTLVGFLTRRGFAEDIELLTSGVDLTTFDPSRWTDRASVFEPQGILVRTLEQLGVDDEHVQRKVYDMWLDIRRDMPMPPGEVQSEVSFEEWWERTNVPSLFPAGYLIAVDGDQFVGTSQLFTSPTPGELRTGLTGVRRAYRRRGLAFGLKVLALGFAKSLGYQRLITENAAVNAGMLAINRELGFVRNPAWVRYVKTFAR